MQARIYGQKAFLCFSQGQVEGTLKGIWAKALRLRVQKFGTPSPFLLDNSSRLNYCGPGINSDASARMAHGTGVVRAYIRGLARNRGLFQIVVCQLPGVCLSEMV